MKGFDFLQKRLQNLEPPPVDLGPWPPQEGSLSWIFYEDLRRPVERMGFMEMYLAAAKQFWESDDEAGCDYEKAGRP